MDSKTKDLFGLASKTRRPAYEAALEKQDRQTRSQRASRIRWLRQKLPRGSMAMPADTWFIFSEAKSTFVDGYFVATVVLTAAFAEHWMAGELEGRGLVKEAAAGLGSCISCARARQIWPDFLLDRLDYLRKIRNPFVHLKDMGHEHSLSRRSLGKNREVGEVIEADARVALETISALVQTRPSGNKSQQA